VAAETTSRVAPGASDEFYTQLVQCLPHLRAFARVLCRQHDLVDDLVQDSVVRALAASNQFQRGTNFKAWMFTILRNQNITTFRRKKIVPASLDDVCPEVSQAAPQEDALMIEDLDHAVQQLSPLRREALILVVVHGLSYEEAASVCGCAVGTIKSRVARARAELQDMVVGRDDETGLGTKARGRRRRHMHGGRIGEAGLRLKKLAQSERSCLSSG
jgi:RNA polymerase sigma-70 factor (ECF subfamily)